jgi:hypothetical protein
LQRRRSGRVIGDEIKAIETDWLADEPDLIALVSEVDFPANREINRQFSKFRPVAPICARVSVATSAPCSKIPYESEQGLFLSGTGSGTGNIREKMRAARRSNTVAWQEGGRMKSVHKSRRSKQESYDEAAEPLQERLYRRPDGKEIPVPLKTGYPGPSERIGADMAVFALRHRRVDIVARYLRETKCFPLHFRCVLADMLEAPTNSTEEYRLEYARRSSGSPKGSTPAARARAQSRLEHIGGYALDAGRHGSKKAQQKFGVSASYVEKAKRLVRAKKNQ